MRYGPIRDAYSRQRIRKENRKKQQQTGTCERCGLVDTLYLFTYVNSLGEECRKMICWDCDFEITNGRGEIDEAPGDIVENRLEDNEGLDL
jgi:hypothetical protein